MNERPLVVAYHHSRLVLMELHLDCIELRARAEFEGRVWKHTALVYTREDAWFVLASSELENSQVEHQETFEAEAFLTKRGALKYAVERVSTMQGKRL